MILKNLVLPPIECNCYIVGSEVTKEAMLVDPGSEPDTILSAVSDLGLSTVMLVATHNHADHVGAVRQVREKTGASFAMHEADLENTVGREWAQMVGFPGDSSAPRPDRLLKDEDIIEVGELRFQVLHTPGHSAGGICLYGHGVVFTGDTLFYLGVGRTDFADGSFTDIINGIHSKLMALPDETIVLPGHGRGSTIGFEREWNSFLR